MLRSETSCTQSCLSDQQRPSRRGGLSRRQSDAVNTFACCSRALYDISSHPLTSITSISTSSSHRSGDGSAGEASADVHRLARVCADEIAGKRFRKGLIDADSVEDAAAMIQAQIYREWGVAIVKGRAECLLALLECTVPNASPRSKVACGKSRDKLIERANVAHCSGGFAEAVLLRRRYAVMKEAARARRR